MYSLTTYLIDLLYNRHVSHQRMNITPTVRSGFRSTVLRAVLLTVLVAIAGALPAEAQTTPAGAHAVVIAIKTEVDLGMLSYVEHALEQAERDHDIVVLDVNTFGGRVDVATKIRDAVMHAHVPLTVAFVDPRAISAGALISLSARKIVMTGGATMGAATPIYSSGEKASEKVVSYMRGEMQTTAEFNHRNPEIAAAMVDESLGVDSVDGFHFPKGKLLTLTTEQALQVKYADTTAETIEQALAELGYPKIEIERTTESAGDKLIRFLTDGVVSGILIMLGLAGLFYTVKTGHFGAITIVAILALTLFFGAQYLTSIAPIIAIVVFIVGVGLLFVEVSPLPSFGLAGVLGLGGMMIGLFLALAGDTRSLTPERTGNIFMTLAIALAGFMLLAFLIIKYAPKATWLKKFSNQSESADMSDYHASIAPLVGKRGTTITSLHPAGVALIDGEKLDVVSRGGMIQAGTEIIIVEVKGNRNVVETAEAYTPIETPHDQEDEPFGGRLPGNLEPRV